MDLDSGAGGDLRYLKEAMPILDCRRLATEGGAAVTSGQSVLFRRVSKGELKARWLVSCFDNREVVK